MTNTCSCQVMPLIKRGVLFIIVGVDLSRCRGELSWTLKTVTIALGRENAPVIALRILVLEYNVRINTKLLLGCGT